MSAPQHDVPAKTRPATIGNRGTQRLIWLVARLLPVAIFFAGGVALLSVLGLAQRQGWIAGVETAPTAGATSPGTIYTCPMHPQIRQPVPGRCPICGMELVPASSVAVDKNELAVTIEPVQRRLANIQTAPVITEHVVETLETIGEISIDESRQATIASYVDGRLQRLFADYTGVEIQAGDHLAVIYSPQLYGAQVEYLEARRGLAGPAGLPAIRKAQETLVGSTRKRLRELGMTVEQIADLDAKDQAESRLTIFAPQGGTVIEKLAIEGGYVKAGDPIYRIADLSSVWLMLKLFPEDAARVRFGQRVEATLQSAPGELLPGRVAFIEPTVDQKPRTVGVRVELPNEQRRLRPGDYARARVLLPIGPGGDVYDADLAGKWISPMHPGIVRDEPGKCPICGMELVPTSRYGFASQPIPQPESMTIPRQAVLLAGGASVVYVETEPGLFEMRPVTLGAMLRDKVVVLEGLAPGERVATAGNFLIDSQMQLAGKPSLLDPSRAVARRAGPLEIDRLDVASLEGRAGEVLEELYGAYFEVQRALAHDHTASCR